MWVYIKNEENEKVVGLRLPASEEKIAAALKNIIVDNNMNSKVIIDSVEDDRANNLFGGEKYNLTEFNAIFRQFDSMEKDQLSSFFTIAEAKKFKSMFDLLNLTQNLHCYDVLDDMTNPKKLAASIEINKRGYSSLQELGEFDGAKYIQDLLADSSEPMVTSNGIVFRNENLEDAFYDGVNLPSLIDSDKPLYLGLKYEGRYEYIFVPFVESELNKVLERLGAEKYGDCEKSIVDFRIENNIKDILMGEIEQIEELTEVCTELQKYVDETEYLSQLTEWFDVNSLAELKILIKANNGIEIFPQVINEEDYGLYIVESKELIDTSTTLGDFIDYKSFGETELSVKDYAFTGNGLIMYNGYDATMIELLNDKFDMKLSRNFDQQEIKYYMPLKVTSFYEENDYGDFEVSDEIVDVCPSELKGLENQLSNSINSYCHYNAKDNGLMEHYKNNDTLKSKVQNLHIAFEEVNGTVYGVAVCKTFAPLNSSEESKLKDYITSQASDGVGESFEQQEIELDGRTVNVSLWSRDWDWELIEESEMNQIEMGMGGM